VGKKLRINNQLGEKVLIQVSYITKLKKAGTFQIKKWFIFFKVSFNKISLQGLKIRFVE